VKLFMAQTFRPGRRFVIGVPFVWLGVFFVVPFLILLRISITDMGNGIDPFAPLFDSSDGTWRWLFKLDNYAAIFRAAADGAGLVATGLGQTIYMDAYITSLKYAFFTTVFCLLIGYPFAYFIARARPSIRPALLMMVMLPFWTSFLLRVYAWKGILADQGVINNALMAVGLIDAPIVMLYTDVSMLVGMTYVYLAFHGFAAVCDAGENGFSLAGGCTRPGRQPVEGFLADHCAAEQGRYCLRRHAGVHSQCGRVRDSLFIGWCRKHHDRACRLGRDVQQQQLAPRLCTGGGDGLSDSFPIGPLLPLQRPDTRAIG